MRTLMRSITTGSRPNTLMRFLRVLTLCQFATGLTCTGEWLGMVKRTSSAPLKVNEGVKRAGTIG